MRCYTPREVVEILKSARTDPHGVALQEVLGSFEKRWRAYAWRWPWLANEHGAAVNAALERVCDRIDELEDEELVWRWATLQFIRVMDGVKKKAKRDAQRKADVSDDDEDGSDPFDRFPSRRPPPDEEAAFRERLAIIASIVRLSREGWLRLMEQLPVDEVARLTERTSDWIRTFTKRLRRALREYLDEGDREVFRKSGLPADLIAKILELLKKK